MIYIHLYISSKVTGTKSTSILITKTLSWI